MAASVIHPSACVDPGAVIAEDCRIGPGCRIGSGARLGRGCVLEHQSCIDSRPDAAVHLGENCRLGFSAYVGAGVRMGRNNRLEHHASVEGDTVLGDDNEVFPHAVIGGIPQDILYQRGQPSRLEVGSHNTFRESVTVNSGTFKEEGVTRIGNRNLLLAGAHVGHDSIIEDDVILVNAVLLGGHVKVERGAVVGGATPLPPFLTVGCYSYIGGFTRVSSDVPPYMSFQGIPGRVVGLNRVGLKRNNFPESVIEALEESHRALFHPARQENMATLLTEMEGDDKLIAEVKSLVAFLRAASAGRDGRARETMHQKWHPKDK